MTDGVAEAGLGWDCSIASPVNAATMSAFKVVVVDAFLVELDGRLGAVLKEVPLNYK